MTTLVWFKKDLRVLDNPALHLACQQNQPVIALYIHCQAWVKTHHIAPVQLHFIQQHLYDLQQLLAPLNIPLRVISAPNAKEIPDLILAFIAQHSIREVFFNAEYPIDELQRDQAVYQQLKRNGIKVHRSHDRVLIVPGRLLNNQQQPYKVFTHFKSKWLQTLGPLETYRPLPAPSPIEATTLKSSSTLEIAQVFNLTQPPAALNLWPVGQTHALARLTEFCQASLFNYHQQRNFPALSGTSSLSPYLAIGSLSIKQALQAVMAASYQQFGMITEAVNVWINELIWREFYQHILVLFPQVCKGQPMQAYTQAFPWQQQGPAWEAWCKGETGIPIIDAAMQQLLATGWMHNRLRMVVAMFLTKHLQVDWRLGEAFFMRHLIDGDFAANNGGWQWSASTGTDAAPYFRIFNPITQAKNYDPEGVFIRTWLPQLKHLSNKQIHSPERCSYYPPPIVNLAEARASTLALFAQIRGHKHAPEEYKM